jgi:hypothetical protein
MERIDSLLLWNLGEIGGDGPPRDNGTSIPTGMKWSKAQTESIGAIVFEWRVNPISRRASGYA